MSQIPDLKRLSDYVFHYAKIGPDREAMVGSDIRWTYSDLARQVDRLACALLAMGVEHGDRIAIMGTPRAECFTVLLAASRIGAITIGLNPKFPMSELQYFVDDAEPKVLLGFAQDEEGDHEEALKTLGRDRASLERVVILGDKDGSITWEALLSEGEAISDDFYARACEGLTPRNPALIVYTSGTTGRPKGAVLPECGLVYCSRVQVDRWDATEDGFRMLVNLPVNHIGFMGDMCSYTLVGGGTMFFMEKFDPHGVLELIQRERLTGLGQVPTMFQLILSQPDFKDYDLSSLKRIIWGGACAPRELIEALSRNGAKLSTSYGMTETTGSVTYTSEDADMDELQNTVGKPDERYEVRIARVDGTPVEPGEEGEIQVRGDHNMIEYWRRPDATAAAFDENGWMHTGDVAVLREDGNYAIRGRLTGMYKSGGENVYPREVEIALEEHPEVAMAAVIGVPDPTYQEVGHAFVMPYPGCDPEPDALRAFCKERLANFKVPKRIEVQPELPMLPIGKIDKVSLKKEALAALEANSEAERQ